MPISQQKQMWPMWGQYHEISRQAGKRPDLSEVERLLELFEARRRAPDSATQEAVWREILGLNADQVYNSEILGGVPPPIAVHRGLRNVPEEAIWNWEPGAQFGIYHPDIFWFDHRAERGHGLLFRPCRCGVDRCLGSFYHRVKILATG